VSVLDHVSLLLVALSQPKTLLQYAFALIRDFITAHKCQAVNSGSVRETLVFAAAVGGLALVFLLGLRHRNLKQVADHRPKHRFSILEDKQGQLLI
jgi:hypothetical protein